MANRNVAEILKMTIRQPLARLSESEAAERAERLRLAGHGFSTARPQSETPKFQEFRKDWQRMMVREE
jgi:hypothetical protein